jgi:transcriptional regulator with XRE-family HTH domain
VHAVSDKGLGDALLQQRAKFLGQRLREIRSAKGMSQTDLANLSGITQASISRYEKGGEMSLPYAEKLAATLGVTMDQFCGFVPLDDAAPSSPLTRKDDPYPNRRRLREEPEFKAAPSAVQEALLGWFAAGGDRSFLEWVRLLDRLLAMEAAGDLAVFMSLIPRVPTRAETKGLLHETVLQTPSKRPRK